MVGSERFFDGIRKGAKRKKADGCESRATHELGAAQTRFIQTLSPDLCIQGKPRSERFAGTPRLTGIDRADLDSSKVASKSMIEKQSASLPIRSIANRVRGQARSSLPDKGIRPPPASR